jgi:predicted transposase/invertase (TIGR01784 family)
LKTDSIFYKIFQTVPGLFFELIGLSKQLGQSYEFRSVELKQTAFRIDGVFLPRHDAKEQTVWFVEVQFQKDVEFYYRFFAELFLFLRQNPQTVDWQAVVIFPGRSIEPEQIHLFRPLLDSSQVQRVYLDDFETNSVGVLGIGLMQLILAESDQAFALAQRLMPISSVEAQSNVENRGIIDLIETIMVYKFPQLSREAIERMFGLSELKQTRVYQEALQEGESKIILRLLERRLGAIAPEVQQQIQGLPSPELEALGDALLDFSSSSDLLNWLSSR